MPAVYARAHWLWYAFSLVGLTSLVAMAIFMIVTRRLDRKRRARV
jgi:hypothetical protein